MSHRPTLDEPVIVSRFFKNRKHDIIVVSLSSFEGRNIVNVRQHFTDKTGIDRPTAKGVAMVVQRLPDLAKAVNAALTKARELALIDSEAGDE
jgi:hypothetical protein